ncbi:gamma-aminobutyric acid type B receptor subunit 1-like [Glandiceps talaboti]
MASMIRTYVDCVILSESSLFYTELDTNRPVKPEFIIRISFHQLPRNVQLITEFDIGHRDLGELIKTGEGDALKILYDFVYKEPKIMMLFLTGSSMIAKPICDVASLYNLVQVSATASSLAFSNKERYPLFIRTTPTDAVFLTAWEALFREFKWNKVAIIFENVEIFTLLMKELVSLLRSRGNYEILTIEHVESGEGPLAQLQSIKAFRTGQYGQRYVWMLLGWLINDWYLASGDGNDDTCTLDEMLTALDGHIAVKIESYASDFNDVDFYGLKPSPADIEIYRHMQSHHYYSGFVYDSVVAIALALNNTNGILSESGHQQSLSDLAHNRSMADILKETILDLKFSGVTGLVQLTDKGDRISDIIIEQKQGMVEQRVNVGRYNVERDKFDWDADILFTWEINGKKPPTDGVQEVTITVSPSETSNQDFKSSTEQLYCHWVYPSAQPLLLSLGMSLAFGAIFMKTYRVFAIFKIAVGKFKQIRVGDTRLILGVVTMVIFDILVSGCWIIADSMSSTTSVLQSMMMALRQNEDGVKISTMREDTVLDKERAIRRLTEKLEKV